MGRVEKTVFISYRRPSFPWALAIFQNLTQHGYDVFLDYNGIPSGDFEHAILGNIRARAHFLTLLTPSALDRCDEPGDWLRREIETALESQRNIVPVLLEGFDFGTPRIASQLTGRLEMLKHYNALSVPPEYFSESMTRLRNRYLNVPLDTVLHPASWWALQAAREQKAAAESAPVVKQEELAAQQWFERGFEASDPDKKLHFYTQSIRLKPDFADALINRGFARYEQGDLEGAAEDSSDAIRLMPNCPDAFLIRANVRREKGDPDGATEDYNEAIRLEPGYAPAYYDRGRMRHRMGDLEGALGDFSAAIRLQPGHAAAYHNRGRVCHDKGDLEGALRDYNEAIRLQPDYAPAVQTRGLARRDDFALALNHRGDARFAQGDLEGALNDYDEAIRLAPAYGLALYNRSNARRAKGDLKGAEEDYRKALTLGYNAKR